MTGRYEIPTVGGYSIPADIGGPDIADARGVVLMAHGIFSNRKENGRFVRQAELHHRLGRRTVAFDWQGHGEHPIPSGQATVAGNVGDLDCIYRHVASEQQLPISIVASSFGASIFLLHQLTGVERAFERALLLNPVTDYISTFMCPQGGELAEGFRKENWDTLWRDGSMSPQPGFTLSLRCGIELLTMRPQLGFDRLDPPTMVIHGTQDQSVSFDDAQRDSARANAVEFRPIEGADHAFDGAWEEEASFALIEEWFA